MKKTTLLAALLTCGVVMTASAQQTYLGVKGVLNIADLDVQSEQGTDRLTASRTLFGTGAILGFSLDNNVSIEVEPMYLHKGATQMATSSSPNIEIDMSVVEIPLYVKVSFGHKIRPFIKAGPTVGIITGAKADSEYGGVVAGQSVRTYRADLDDALENIEMGVSVAAGMSYTSGKYNWFIAGQYSAGLVDLYKGGTIEWESNGDTFVVQGKEAAQLSTKGFQVVMGVTIPLTGSN
jgi:hypothetical protein